MDLPELYSIIDSIARSHPPGGLRLTPIELVEWLELVAKNPKADRAVKRDAARAAKHVHKLITGTYEMPNHAPPPAPAGSAVAAGGEFDESTPPPRTRPKGAPLPRCVKLALGEDLKGLFAEWDREGRVPAGSILAQLIGRSPTGTGTESGYRLLAVAQPTTVMCPPGSSRELKSRDLDGMRVAVEIRRERDPEWYVIFAPLHEKGGR